MNDLDDLKDEIIRFLIDRKDKKYTANQITSSLGLKKDNVLNVQLILNQLVLNRVIEKISNRYSINVAAELASVLSAPVAAISDCHSGDWKSPLRVTGKFDATSLAKNNSFAFVIIEDGEDIFISSEDTLNAYHNDIVEVEVTRSRYNKQYGIIKNIIKRNKEKFIGTVEKVRNKYYFRADNLKIHTQFEIYESSEDLDNHKVAVNIINWGIRSKNKLPICRIHEVLGISGNPEIEILSVIKEYDLPLYFPEKVIAEAESISGEINDIDLINREDFRNLYTITIDPISAKDFDDAISLIEKENGDLYLYVHIADVAHFVTLNSNIFYEAQNRGNSYYFPKKVIPMLPERLSNNLCSLRPEEDKFAITVLTVFSKDGHIKKQDIFESIIKSNIRLSYEEVDDYFNGNNTKMENGKWRMENESVAAELASVPYHSNNMSTELIQTLNVMRKLSEYLSLNRYQRGYLKFDLPEVEYVYDDDGYLEDLIRTKETESHILIENFMLLANEYVAKLLTKKAKSTIYRIHEEPEERDLKNIINLLHSHKISFKIDVNINKTWQNALESLPDEKYHRVFDKIILRSMKKAKYSINHKVHFGLGLDTYTHFTSPIRRLCDLIVHQQLKHYIFKKKTEPIDLFKIAGIASEKEMIADDAERLMESKVISSFMKKNIGQIYKAIITNLSPSSIFIELDDIPVKGLIKLNGIGDDFYIYDEKKYQVIGQRKGKIFKLCDTIKVILIGVGDDIIFDTVEKIRKKKGSHKKSRERF